MKNPTPQKNYTVRIPVKPHLKKYVEAFHGQVQLNYSSILSTVILSLLSNDEFDIKQSNPRKDARLSTMTEDLDCIAPLTTMHYKGFALTADKVIAISRYLESAFAEDLHRFCEQNKKDRNWRPGINQAIESFAAFCRIDIDEDISYDALQKCEYRQRKRVEKKLVSFVHSQPGILPAPVAI